jgi:hypothetical protein
MVVSQQLLPTIAFNAMSPFNRKPISCAIQRIVNISLSPVNAAFFSPGSMCSIDISIHSAQMIPHIHASIANFIEVPMDFDAKVISCNISAIITIMRSTKLLLTHLQHPGLGSYLHSRSALTEAVPEPRRGIQAAAAQCSR